MARLILHRCNHRCNIMLTVCFLRGPACTLRCKIVSYQNILISSTSVPMSHNPEPWHIPEFLSPNVLVCHVPESLCPPALASHIPMSHILRLSPHVPVPLLVAAMINGGISNNVYKRTYKIFHDISQVIITVVMI